MNEFNKELFEFKFTSQPEFKSSYEKIKCFRVMDEEGNIPAENKVYEDSIDKEML